MGRVIDLTAKVTDAAGNVTTQTTSITVASTMKLGMTVPPTNWSATLANFPGIQYTRDFGKDNLYKLPNGQYDPDNQTEWSKWGTGKWLGAPSNMVNHLSVKDDTIEFLADWFDTIPNDVAPTHPGVVLSPWHEPEDDVRAGTITTSWFRAQGTALANFVNSHPKGWLVKAMGPILTRYDLDELNNDPSLYGFEGMTHFFFDSYQSPTNTGYYFSNQKMIDIPVARIRAKFPGIRIGIPEFGYSLQANDPTGQARAVAITSVVNYCKSLGYIDYFAYFNDVGSIPAVPFTATSPEGIAYKQLLLAQ